MLDNQFTSKINEYLLNTKVLDQKLLDEAAMRVSWAFKRQLMSERENKPCLRMSSGGQCVRKQFYGWKGIVGEPLSPRTINTFLNGDILEVQMSILGRLAGWQLLGKENGEDEISLSVTKTWGQGEQPEEFKIYGHPDDLLYVPEENETYLVEYKTASDYGYERFEKEGLDDQWGYATQASCYAEALGVDKYILMMCCKSTGHMCDHVYKKDPALVSAAMDKWSRIINIDEMPERGFDAVPETVYNRKTKERDETGRKILGLNCSYCSQIKNCWSDRITTEFKGEKPIFVVS